MEVNNLKKKLTTLIVLLCALAIALIYVWDLKNDYYFHFSKKKSTANIEQIKKVHEYRPYIIALAYLNEKTNKQERCTLKVDGNTGSKLNDGATIDILYTEQNACDVYIEGYKNPTKAGLVIHLVIFLIAVIACIVFSKKLLRKEN